MRVKIFTQSPFVEKMDAASRVELFAANDMASGDIIRYADVTRIRGGGITYGSGTAALLPSFNGDFLLAERLADGSSRILPHMDFAVSMTLATANGISVDKNNLFLCEKLRLFERDPDKENGYLKRCFCDQGQLAPLGVTPLLFRYGNGSFDCIQEFFWVDGYATVMEVKYFKMIDRPGLRKLYFRPKRSRLWMNNRPGNGGNLYISSELWITELSWDNICWYQNCGDLESIDFSLLRGWRSTFWIMEFVDDPLRTRNAYAEAAAFKAAALRQEGSRISTSAIHLGSSCELRGARGKEYANASEKLLSDDDFLKKCQAFRIPIDPILHGNPYEIKLRKSDTVTAVVSPFFFRGRLSLFQELAANRAFRAELCALLGKEKTLGGGPSSPVSTLIFCRKVDRYRLGKQLLNRNRAFLSIYQDSLILDSGPSLVDALEELLVEIRPEVVLLDISGYSTSQEQMLLDAVDICLSNSISVGVFCGDGHAPSALLEMADHNFIIRTAERNVHIIKEKNPEKKSWIRKFDFSSETVSVAESNEDEL